MSRWLRWPWALFKWSMIFVGVLVVYVTLFRQDKSSDEVFLVGGTSCDFSFGLPKGEWTADPNSATYANIPVMVRKSELGNPNLFLSINRFFRDEKSPGDWFVVTQEKCQLERRDVIRTKDGKEARVFLASSCDVSGATHGGRIESPFRGHTLYGWVAYNDKEADFLYLSSSDQGLVRKHEDVLLSALKSYSTSSPNCVARRSTVKTLEITR
jgi:hypothetical protein